MYNFGRHRGLQRISQKRKLFFLFNLSASLADTKLYDSCQTKKKTVSVGKKCLVEKQHILQDFSSQLREYEVMMWGSK